MDKSESTLSKARQLLFAMLSKLSNVDGMIEGDEICYILDLLNFTEQDREPCIRAFSTARRSRRTIFDYAADFVALGLSNAQRAEAYDRLWRVAIADHILRAPEKFLLQDVCAKLNLSPSEFGVCYARYRKSFADEELNETPTLFGEVTLSGK